MVGWQLMGNLKVEDAVALAMGQHLRPNLLKTDEVKLPTEGQFEAFGLAYIFLKKSKTPWDRNRHSRHAIAILDQPHHGIRQACTLGGVVGSTIAWPKSCIRLL
ncbi:hypothetical protein LWI29_015296 [Acer saccharum]|uniref:Uncharacterized protein n=1 Tax=Acer saccharum TaxID=4024 RepID=A0AA39VHL6_ACESA|nr:hypothetical protein LWI29_015296 [Acer saccharum]